MHEGVAIALYGDDSWRMAVAEKKKLNVMEMRCLKNMSELTHMDQVRNEVVRRSTGIMRDGWSSRAECVEVVWTQREN